MNIKLEFSKLVLILQSPTAPDSDPNMKTELYKRTNEQNRLIGISLESSCSQNKPRENVDGNVLMGSPIPKHRRQQQLQENLQGARGIHLDFYDLRKRKR